MCMIECGLISRMPVEGILETCSRAFTSSTFTSQQPYSTYLRHTKHCLYVSCSCSCAERHFIRHFFFLKKYHWKTSAVSTTDGWLKLNFASCVIRKTRSLGALVLCSICNMVFVNYIYDVVADTRFHKFHGRPFARVLYVYFMKDVGR